MAVLADQIRSCSHLRHPAFYASVLAGDIMRTRWSLHLSAWIIRKARRVTSAQAWYFLLVTMRTKYDAYVIHHAVEELARHVESGKDKVDPRSAAGLNGGELSLLLGLMAAHGWRDPRAEVKPVAESEVEAHNC
jgi:hypothetical protein